MRKVTEFSRKFLKISSHRGYSVSAWPDFGDSSMFCASLLSEFANMKQENLLLGLGTQKKNESHRLLQKCNIIL